MRLIPVVADAGVDDQRHGKRHRGAGRAFHHVTHRRDRVIHLLFRHLEQQLVMHL